uniref:Uncharacterized protein n=1 Tax=Peronospora matthiolae TaxID=2874970 RepID=A0AAV1U6V7_9STRA
MVVVVSCVLLLRFRHFDSLWSLATMEFLACSTYYILTSVGIDTGGAHGHPSYTVDKSKAVVSCVGIEPSQALLHD